MCLLSRVPFAVQNHFPVRYDSHVSAVLNELHDLLASASHLSPSRFGLRILLDTHDRVAVEHECKLSQAFCFAPCDGICVTGKITSYRGVPEIIATERGQIVVQK